LGGGADIQNPSKRKRGTKVKKKKTRGSARTNVFPRDLGGTTAPQFKKKRPGGPQHAAQEGLGGWRGGGKAEKSPKQPGL